MSLNHRAPYRRPDMRAQLPSMPTNDAAWRDLTPQDRHRLTVTWYEARNRRDGTPFPLPAWTAQGAARHCRRVKLAAAMLVAVQAGRHAEYALMVELDDARQRVAELKLVADAGCELAQALAAVQELSPLALRATRVAGADTATIPKQGSLSS